MIGHGGGDAEGLAAHLTACFPEFSDRLHGIEGLVEGEAAVQVLPVAEGERDDHGHGVTRPRRPFEVGVDERPDACRIADLARLDVRLEPEGMGVAAAGKEAVGELEQAQQGISAHGRGRPRWD